MPSSKETSGRHPIACNRETSISLRGVPSGRDESHLISPSCPTIFCTKRASSETVRSSPTPMFIIPSGRLAGRSSPPVSYTHLRAHETVLDLVCRLLLEKKKNRTSLYSTAA